MLPGIECSQHENNAVKFVLINFSRVAAFKKFFLSIRSCSEKTVILGEMIPTFKKLTDMGTSNHHNLGSHD